MDLSLITDLGVINSSRLYAVSSIKPIDFILFYGSRVDIAMARYAGNRQ